MSQVITVFGSAHPAPDDETYREATELGKRIAQAGFTLCNGGYGGTMEAAAKGARDGGGSTIGVTISRLRLEPNRWITRAIPMPTLIDRLQKLVDLGDGYVVLRGGTGTLLELALVWELLAKNLMPQKPLVCLGEFWSPLISTMKRQLASEDRPMAQGAVTMASTPEECVTILADALRT